MKKVRTKIDHFWQTKESTRYNKFGLSIPSNFVPYSLVYHLAGVSNYGTLLDFGCFQGISSEALLNSTGSDYAVGVDIVKKHIDIANERYANNNNLKFYEVGFQDEIPQPFGLYDASIMTFVHVNFENMEIFNNALRKINSVSKKGANLVILGLHPNSFNNYNFLAYKHSLPLDTEYKDMEIFDNELHIPGGDILKFQNYCWTSETIRGLLEKNNFENVKIINLTEDLSGKEGRLLNSLIKKVGNKFNVNWEDEWKAPLYQIIVATKK